MKIAAAEAIAAAVSERDLHEEYIIPSVFDRSVARAVARAVAEAAYRTGAGVRHHKNFGAHLWLAT
jgi:malate dehydrogenase (oxaloacetate-decarboxylating)